MPTLAQILAAPGTDSTQQRYIEYGKIIFAKAAQICTGAYAGHFVTLRAAIQAATATDAQKSAYLTHSSFDEAMKFYIDARVASLQGSTNLDSYIASNVGAWGIGTTADFNTLHTNIKTEIQAIPTKLKDVVSYIGDNTNGIKGAFLVQYYNTSLSSSYKNPDLTDNTHPAFASDDFFDLVSDIINE
jgi:hypothetical protein